MAAEQAAGLWQPPADPPTVEQMVRQLDHQVMGLAVAKRRLAVVLRRHAVSGIKGRDFKQPNLLVIGPTGCLQGDEEVETVDGPRPIRDLLGWSAIMGPQGPALAYGYRGGRAPLFRVEHQQGSFTATAAHRCLTPRGWRRVSELVVGEQLQGFADVPLRTTSGTVPSARPEDALRSWRTLRDSLDGCSPDRRHGDAPPQWAVAFAPGFSQQQADALAHTHCGLPDALAHGLARIPTCQSSGLLATLDSTPSDYRSPGWWQYQTQPVVASLSAGSNPEQQRYPGWRHQPWLALEVGQCPDQYGDAPVISSTVLGIVPVGEDEYFDLVVPGAPYYRTKGGWAHHNGGKSFLTERAVEAAGLPYILVNATQFSEVGFAGLDVSQMLSAFWSPKWAGLKANGQPGSRDNIVPLAQRFGVVLIDEIDKWAFHPNLKERQPQRVLQAELLRFCDGEIARVRERDSEAGTSFDTKHLLFIGVGAFQSLGNLVDPYDPAGYIKATPEHIVRYGFLEELAGRFSTIIGLPLLDAQSLTEILRLQVWPQYVQEAEDEGIVLDVDETALRTIVDIAIHQKVGARGLVPICEKHLWDPWSKAKPGDTILGRHHHIPGGFELVRA